MYWYQWTELKVGTPGTLKKLAKFDKFLLEQALKLVLMDFDFTHNLRVSTAAGGFRTE